MLQHLASEAELSVLDVVAIVDACTQKTGQGGKGHPRFALSISCPIVVPLLNNSAYGWPH